jgi:hypothetical protein
MELTLCTGDIRVLQRVLRDEQERIKQRPDAASCADAIEYRDHLYQRLEDIFIAARSQIDEPLAVPILDCSGYKHFREDLGARASALDNGAEESHPSNPVPRFRNRTVGVMNL